MSGFFKRPANRFCAFFGALGSVPVASDLDDKPKFLSLPPQKVGDISRILVEGQKRKVILLPSTGMLFNPTYLVDMGPA